MVDMAAYKNTLNLGKMVQRARITLPNRGTAAVNINVIIVRIFLYGNTSVYNNKNIICHE